MFFLCQDWVPHNGCYKRYRFIVILFFFCFCPCSASVFLKHFLIFNLKRLGGSQFDSPCCFFTNVSPKKRLKPYLFVTFNIIISHIFPENFIEIPQVVQKILRLSMSILAIFINFHHFFGFFNISLLQRNKWYELITDDVSIFNTL